MKQQRNTKQRKTVLDAVRARCDHPNAERIYLDVQAIDDKISRATVYRNLKILVKQGEILLVKLPHINRFESRLDMHYHLLCTGCGHICDVPFTYNSEYDMQVAEKTGYSVVRHRTIFEGLCRECQKGE